jgi:hypothetical protein
MEPYGPCCPDFLGVPRLSAHVHHDCALIEVSGPWCWGLGPFPKRSTTWLGLCVVDSQPLEASELGVVERRGGIERQDEQADSARQRLIPIVL